MDEIMSLLHVNAFPREPFMTLALDVSSSCTGWAVFGSRGLHAFGAIKPSASLDSIKRIDNTVNQVLSIVQSFEPSMIVMEWTRGRLHHRATAGREPTGLAVMGQAQGAVRQAVRGLRYRVETFDESWTNRRRKETRAAETRTQFPDYASVAEHDPGMDVADAIALGDWYLRNERTKQLAAVGKSLGIKLPNGARMRKGGR